MQLHLKNLEAAIVAVCWPVNGTM